MAHRTSDLRARVDRTLLICAMLLGLLLTETLLSTAWAVWAGDELARQTEEAALLERAAGAADMAESRFRVALLRNGGSAGLAWERAAASAELATRRLAVHAEETGTDVALVESLTAMLREKIKAERLAIGKGEAGDPADLPDVAEPPIQATGQSDIAAAIARVRHHQEQRIGHYRQLENVLLRVAIAVLATLLALTLMAVYKGRAAVGRVLQHLHTVVEKADRGLAELAAFNEATPLAVFHLDARGIPQRVNPVGTRWVGCGGGGSAAHFIRGRVDRDHMRRVSAAWRSLMTRGSRFDQVFRFRAPDGSTVWAHGWAGTVELGGMRSGVIGLLQDVTHEHSLQEELAQSRRRMRRMTDSVPALMARIDKAETYRFVNETYRQWFGDAAPRVGTTIVEFLGLGAYERIQPVLDAVRAGKPQRFEMMQPDFHGRPLMIDVTFTPDMDERNTFCGLYIMATDISERKRLEEGLFAAKELAQVTLDSIGDAVLTTNRSGIITFANRRASELLDREAHDMVGAHVESVVRLQDRERREQAISLEEAMVTERIAESSNVRQLVRRDGSRVAVEDVAAPVRARDGSLVGGVVILRDVSMARAAAERLRELAEMDSLTGLPNRLVFDHRLEVALRRQTDAARVIIIYMDLDGFKAINDFHGHGAGDDVLRQFAVRLAGWTANGDTVCRLGGDEFVALLLPPISMLEAAVAAETFVAAARTPFPWNATSLSVSLSAGIAQSQGPEEGAVTLMRRADMALYEAKQAGKNRIRLSRS